MSSAAHPGHRPVASLPGCPDGSAARAAASALESAIDLEALVIRNGFVRSSAGGANSVIVVGGVNGAGRDHWTHCLSVLMAGGGIRGGQTYGASDRFGEYPANQPLTPADITKTVYYATGTNDLQARDAEGRPYNLLDEGNPITALF